MEKINMMNDNNHNDDENYGDGWWTMEDISEMKNDGWWLKDKLIM